MPRYDHLPLRRIEGQLDRRKFGGGRPPNRDARTHGATIQAELEEVIETNNRRPKIADIDPALILKIRTAGPTDEADWARLGLSVIASDPDKTLILFADNKELQEFKRRVAAYQLDPPKGQKHPQFAGFVAAIEKISEVSSEDRIGPALRAEGFINTAKFVDGRREILDVELWQPSTEKAARSP